MYYPVVCTLLEGIRSLKGRNRMQLYCCSYPLSTQIYCTFCLLPCWTLGFLGLTFCKVIVIFCEVVAIYGVIVAIILQTKLESVPASNIYAPESLRVRYAIFASGIIMGFANLVYGSSVQMIFLYVGSCRRRWTTTINEQLEGSF
uniref:Uncharacterized protein n=1 Tax=Vitis vinifera TaxID=29760 RepID=F6H2I0_VITVI